MQTTKIEIRFWLNVPTILVNIGVSIVLWYRRRRYGYGFRRIPLTRGQYAIVDPEDYEWLSKYKWHANTGRGKIYAVNSRMEKMHRLVMGADIRRKTQDISKNPKYETLNPKQIQNSNKENSKETEILHFVQDDKSNSMPETLNSNNVRPKTTEILRSVRLRSPQFAQNDPSSLRYDAASSRPQRSEVFVDHINGDGRDNRKANLRLATPMQNTWNVKGARGKSRYKGVKWHKRIKKWAAVISVNGKRRHLGYFDDEDAAARSYDKVVKEER